MTKKEIEHVLARLKILEDENLHLKEENAYLKFELEELRSKRYKSGRNKPPDDTIPPPAQKKRGGLFGHAGRFRKKPIKVDHVEELRLTSCPACGGGGITECKKVEEHIQEDIVLPEVKATMYRRHHYYCKKCKAIVSSKGSGELTRNRIGPAAKSFAVFLRYVVKISERDVQALFEKAFNLKIAASSIAGFRDKLKEEALPLYGKLVEALREGRFIHADETGWKVKAVPTGSGSSPIRKYA